MINRLTRRNHRIYLKKNIRKIEKELMIYNRVSSKKKDIIKSWTYPYMGPTEMNLGILHDCLKSLNTNHYWK